MTKTTELLSQEMPAVPASVPTLRHAVATASAPYDPTAIVRYRLALCVTEALSNSITHAYIDADEVGCVYVLMSIRGRMIHMTVGDDGRGVLPRFDSPGLGLGLAIIATAATDVALSAGRADGGAEIRMLFDLDAD
jgi:anti-sigma regulatory factor (Ser/Thr protein kinase)